MPYYKVKVIRVETAEVEVYAASIDHAEDHAVSKVANYGFDRDWIDFIKHTVDTTIIGED